MKKVKIILGIVFIFGSIILGYNLWIKQAKHQFEKETEAEMTVLKSQYYQNAYKAIEKLESLGIKIDKKYQNEIKNVSKFIVENYNIEIWNVQTLAEIMFLNSVYEVGNEKELFKKLDEYYIEDKKIFSEYPYKSFSGNENEEEEFWVRLTITIMKELSNSTILDRYKLCEGIAKWYNASIGKEGADKDLLVDTFFMLDSKNNLDLIDKNSILPFIEKDMLEGQDEVYKDSSMTSILFMKRVNRFNIIFNDDYKYDKAMNEMLSNMSNLRELEYSQEESTFILFLEMMLEGVTDVKNDCFFSKNISRCIIENYEKIMNE